MAQEIEKQLKKLSKELVDQKHIKMVGEFS